MLLYPSMFTHKFWSINAYLWMLTFLSMSTFTNMQMLLCTFLPVHFLLLHGFLRCTQSQSAVSVPWGLFPVEWFGRIWLLPSLPWTWHRNTGCRRRGLLCGQGSPSNPPLSSHHKAGPACYNKTDCETLSDQHNLKQALFVTKQTLHVTPNFQFSLWYLFMWFNTT